MQNRIAGPDDADDEGEDLSSSDVEAEQARLSSSAAVENEKSEPAPAKADEAIIFSGWLEKQRAGAVQLDHL